MSLLDSAFEACHFINKTKAPDGYGGTKTVYSLGVKTEAAIVFNTSLEARVADKQGVTSLYTITTKRNNVLEYHDLLQRDSDKKVFRITSDGDDSATPAAATLDMRQVTAEEYVLGGPLNG